MIFTNAIILIIGIIIVTIFIFLIKVTEKSMDSLECHNWLLLRSIEIDIDLYKLNKEEAVKRKTFSSIDLIIFKMILDNEIKTNNKKSLLSYLYFLIIVTAITTFILLFFC